MDLTNTPHHRFNPLTREWVLVSPHRTERPWSGKVEAATAGKAPEYDPQCYLCPRNARAGGARNPDYKTTFVFDNDYPALLPDVPEGEIDEAGLLYARSERGICRVVCFSPRHDLTIGDMEVADIARVINVWTDQYRELGAVDWVKHVQIFENRGLMMGASNPHPHGQIWANAMLPNEPARELESFRVHAKTHGGKCLLCEYAQLERNNGTRVVYENDEFLVVVPFWAVWPFEVLVISRRHVGALTDFSGAEKLALADVVKQVAVRYDRVFDVTFPYSMGFHQRPTDGDAHAEWHWHAHYYPPLLRSATVRKWMVGYEMLCTPQRDITPESAAKRLREARGHGAEKK
jgi:UDPglucose--hexose-1-phosphate uridylyltransferase